MAFFRTKSKQPVPPAALQLPVVGNSGSTAGADELSLEQKLELEKRTCATCAYTIHNPMTDRCPRCFSTVPLSEHTNCGDCAHQGNCEFERIKR